jgi:small subunit ribosomal protein S16
MSVRVRLTRVGSKKNPIWRVVVADQRSPRDGRFIETIGHYNPQTNPSTIVIDEGRFQHWVSRGAQPSNQVKQLVKAHSKGIEGGTSTGSAGVSQGGAVAVAEADAEAQEAPSDVVEERAEAPAETPGEPPAGEPADIETPADEPAEAETPPDEAPAEPAEGDAAS